MPDKPNSSTENHNTDEQISNALDFGTRIGKRQSAKSYTQSSDAPHPPKLTALFGWMVRDWDRSGINFLEPKELWPLFLALLTIALAAYTVRTLVTQLGEMQTQTAQLYRQSEIENAGASHRAVEVDRQLRIARDQANAALKQAHIAQETFDAINRPYVGVGGVSISFLDESGQPRPVRSNTTTAMTFNAEYQELRSGSRYKRPMYMEDFCRWRGFVREIARQNKV